AEIITNEILELNARGATIIFSTHRMESVEQLCDSIALINRSKKILDGKVKDIKNSYRSHTFRIHYSGNINRLEANRIFNILNHKTDVFDNEITIQIHNGYSTNDALSLLLNQVTINSLTEVVPSINDIFI